MGCIPSFRRGLIVLCAALLLTACMALKTPQEVAQRFWESAIADDADGAVEHSTPVRARDYDAFSRDWSGFQPAWGKVVIEGKATDGYAFSATPQVLACLAYQRQLPVVVPAARAHHQVKSKAEPLLRREGPVLLL